MQSLYQISAAVAAALLLAASPAAAKPSAGGPFAGLAGSWSGGGTAAFEGGSNERMRCSATYRPSGGGNTLSMTIRCATASLNLQLNGNLRSSGGRVSGSWSESTTGAGGSAIGRASPGSIRLRIGGTMTGNLAVSYSGSSQSVSVSGSGSVFRRANISLRRR